jgi:hypothetical protein
MPTGSIRKDARTTWKKPGPFSSVSLRNDKSQAKRNPEKWGDNSGLNVAYIKTSGNKLQAPEHNA